MCAAVSAAFGPSFTAPSEKEKEDGYATPDSLDAQGVAPIAVSPVNSPAPSPRISKPTSFRAAIAKSPANSHISFSRKAALSVSKFGKASSGAQVRKRPPGKCKPNAEELAQAQRDEKNRKEKDRKRVLELRKITRQRLKERQEKEAEVKRRQREQELVQNV